MIQRGISVKHHNHAMLGLPYYLLIVLIVTTLLFSLLTQAIMSYQQQTQQQELQESIHAVISSSEYLSIHASQGSAISTSMFIPSLVKMIAFGPPPLDICKKLGFVNRSHVPDNLYAICFNDGRINYHYTTFSFSYNLTSNAHIFFEGNHPLLIEVLEIKGKSYVQITQKRY